MAEILPQGVPVQVVGEQEFARVGVAGELHAEHFRRFPLVPFGGPENIRDGGDPGPVPRKTHPHHDRGPGFVGEQPVDELHGVVRRPVQRRHENKEVERKLVAEPRQVLPQRIRVHRDVRRRVDGADFDGREPLPKGFPRFLRAPQACPAGAILTLCPRIRS